MNEKVVPIERIDALVTKLRRFAEALIIFEDALGVCEGMTAAQLAGERVGAVVDEARALLGRVRP